MGDCILASCVSQPQHLGVKGIGEGPGKSPEVAASVLGGTEKATEAEKDGESKKRLGMPNVPGGQVSLVCYRPGTRLQAPGTPATGSV